MISASFVALSASYFRLHELLGILTWTKSGVFAPPGKGNFDLDKSIIYGFDGTRIFVHLRLGRARVVVDAAKIAALRASGASWRIVCEKTGLNEGNSSARAS